MEREGGPVFGVTLKVRGRYGGHCPLKEADHLGGRQTRTELGQRHLKRAGNSFLKSLRREYRRPVAPRHLVVVEGDGRGFPRFTAFWLSNGDQRLNGPCRQSFLTYKTIKYYPDLSQI